MANYPDQDVKAGDGVQIDSATGQYARRVISVDSDGNPSAIVAAPLYSENDAFTIVGANEQVLMDWVNIATYRKCGYDVKTGAGGDKTIRVYGVWDENQPATDPGGADSVQLQAADKVIGASSTGAEYFTSRPTWIGITVQGVDAETLGYHFAALP